MKHNSETQRILKFLKLPPSHRDGYTVVTPFEGANYDDLINNIESYLNELITKINEPLKECECCKGNGVILND